MTRSRAFGGTSRALLMAALSGALLACGALVGVSSVDYDGDVECAKPSDNLLDDTNDLAHGCAEWQGMYLTSIEDSPAGRCGGRACLVCPSPDAVTGGGIVLSPALAWRPGERYTYSISLRAAPDSGIQRLVARFNNNGSWLYGATPVLTDWGVSSVTWDVPDPAPGPRDVTLDVVGDYAGGASTCFLAADAVLRRVLDAGQ